MTDTALFFTAIYFLSVFIVISLCGIAIVVAYLLCSRRPYINKRDLTIVIIPGIVYFGTLSSLSLGEVKTLANVEVEPLIMSVMQATVIIARTLFLTRQGSTARRALALIAFVSPILVAVFVPTLSE